MSDKKIIAAIAAISEAEARVKEGNEKQRQAIKMQREGVLKLAKAKAELAAFETGEKRGSRAYQAVYNKIFERVHKEEQAKLRIWRERVIHRRSASRRSQ